MAKVNITTKEIITAERETFQKSFVLEDLVAKWGIDFAETDFAKVGIKNAAGKTVYEKYFPITDSRFVFRMDYKDATKIPKGNYIWDFAIVFGAVFGDEGKLTNCRDFTHPILTAKYTVKEAAA
jgi:hypothetical protein